MHHDVVITNPAWIDLLINVCESHQAGMIGVEIQSYFLQGKKIDFIREWLVMFTRECWEECGPFPEELPMIGPAFLMTLKAQQMGQAAEHIVAAKVWSQLKVFNRHQFAFN